MPTIVQFRRGTNAQNDTFTGSAGEITIDTTNKTIRVHDASTAGGSRLATVKYTANTYETKASANTRLANTNTYIATKVNTTNPTTSGLLAHTGRATISTNLSVSGNTSVTGLKANNSLGSSGYFLRSNGTAAYWDALPPSTQYLQVSNAVATYATKSNPTTSGVLAHTGRATISTNLAVSGNATITGYLDNHTANSRFGWLKADYIDVGDTTQLGNLYIQPSDGYIVFKVNKSNINGSYQMYVDAVGPNAGHLTHFLANGTYMFYTSQGGVTIGQGNSLSNHNFILNGAGQLYLKKTLTVNQSATLNQNLMVSGNSAITGNETVSGTLTSTGLLTASGRATVGTNLTVSGNTTLGAAGKTITTTGAWTHTGTATISTNLIVSGNLTISGTTTTVNSTTLAVADKNIELAKGSSTDAAADGGGITLHGTTDHTWNWVSATGAWTSSDNINLASGKSLYLNGTDFRATYAANSYVKSTLANTNSYIKSQLANTNTWNTTQDSRLTLINTNLTSTNTALRSLISTNAATELSHLANTNAYIATKAASSSPTTSGYLNHTGKARISTNIISGANTVVGGQAIIQGALNANSSATVAGLLTASGRATVGTNLTVSGNTTLGAAGKTITSTGAWTHTGTKTISTNLTVSGNTTLNATVDDSAAAYKSQTLTDGATVTWNASLGRIATLTLGGNRTMAAPTNLKVGHYTLTVIQDATGSRTITWNGAFKWPAQTAPTLTTTANARDILTFVSDGTLLYGTYVNDVR